MNPRKAGRPSPALVLAALALVFAMVGTAIAGPDAISSKITKSKVKKISAKQANKAIDAAEPDLNVNSAKTADEAETADTATTAGGPVAWAHVNGAGQLIAGRGVEAGDVTAGAANYRCFSGIDAPFRAVQVTVDYWNGTPTFSTIAQGSVVGQGNSSTGGTGCAAGTQAFVRGQNANTGVGSTVGFFISFID